MPEPRKRKRTRKSTAKVSDINETNGAHPEQPMPEAEAASVEHAEVPVEPWWDVPAHEQEPVALSEVEPIAAPEPAMEIYQERSLEYLLRDNGFMNQIVHVMTQSKFMDSLAEDLADKLKDALASDQNFRRRLVIAAVSTEDFTRKVVRTLVEISG